MTTLLHSTGYPETLTITVHTPAQRLAVEHALAIAQELDAVTEAAAPGQVLDCCEEAAVAKGQEFTRTLLQQTLQQFVDRQEKKEACVSVPAVASAARTKARTRKKP
jgi:hypothetical protein